MRFPWANTIVLALVAAQLASGSLGLVSGSLDRRWALWLHNSGAYGLLLALFWKGRVIFYALAQHRRPTPARLVFLILLALLVATLAAGLLWTFGGRRLFFGYSLITIHIALAGSVLFLVVWHIYFMRFIFRVRGATDRRAFLRLGVMAIGGLIAWQFAENLLRLVDLPGAHRRFTGSYEVGSNTGVFPYVIWLADNVPPVDVAHWRLVVDGTVDRPLTFGYEQIAELVGDTATEIIDCTGGWYSTQQWRGVRVGRLLEAAGVKPGTLSVSFEAVSGYGRRFKLDEARTFLLALEVNGKVLDHGHGFPLRLVAPDHRGFEWVKWLGHVRLNDTSHLLQPPVPLQ